MAGILKFRGQNKATQHLVLPAEKDWELWSYQSPMTWTRVRSLTLAELATVPLQTRVGLPTRQLITVPLWLQSTDSALFAEMVILQLERRGHPVDPGSTLLHYQVVRQESERTLVLVLLLSARLPAELCLTQAEAYDLAALCRPLAAEGYSLWREEERLVIAATHQGQMAYAEASTQKVVNQDALHELRAIQLRLQGEGVMPEGAPLTLMASFTEEERQLIEMNFPVVHCTPLPAPIWREAVPRLMPPAVQHARTHKQRQQRVWRGWAVGGLIYLIFILGLAGRVGWLAWQTAQLQQELKAHAATVEDLQSTAERWRALQLAIDPSFYPIETLLACVQALPAEVRLTQFEHNGGKLLIMGESKDASSAFKYLGQIQAEPYLKKWMWNMPQPQILPNNRAQFQMEGTRVLAPTQ